MKKSIRRQLIVAFIGLAIIPLLVLGGIFSWLSYSAIRSEALRIQAEMAKEPAVRLDTSSQRRTTTCVWLPTCTS
jgi:predicted DNA repair protein MutK